MPTLVELTTQIVTAQTTASALSTDEILSSLTRIHTTLGQLEAGTSSTFSRETAEPALKLEKAFKKNEVVCLICGKSFTTLGSHLSRTHGITPTAYRKRFAISKNQPLSAKAYLEKLRNPQNLDRLDKARAEHTPKKHAENAAPAKVIAPAKLETAAPPGAKGTLEEQEKSEIRARRPVGRPPKGTNDRFLR